MPSAGKTARTGLVVTYIENRLYLGAYSNPPSAETVFPPYAAKATPSPGRKPSGAAAAAAAVEGERESAAGRPAPFYFSVDESLPYNPFHHDFGPLHIGHLYRFALEFHEVLAAADNAERPIVFWSQSDGRSRANAACLMACYMVLVQNWSPHLALAPIAQVEPALMPFRDAGYSQADYGISVQDVVYGVWRARETGCCALDSFDLAEYETFERVEHGDFNWITADFVAFASPQLAPVEPVAEGSAAWARLPRDLAAVEADGRLPDPFKNVLYHFAQRGVGLVLRLNSPLYSPSWFEAVGIRHMDMIFDDGTCPPLPTVRRFIQLAHDTIAVRRQAIAVHCKAGLGRTGCLIGAYLIYRYGFPANEAIAFMRFMRPGMVVGPQQHWLHLHQATFREWWVQETVERRVRREMAAAAAASAAAASSAAASSAAANAAANTAANAAATAATASVSVSISTTTVSAASPSTPVRAMRKASRRNSNSNGNTHNTAGAVSTPPPPPHPHPHPAHPPSGKLPPAATPPTSGVRTPLADVSSDQRNSNAAAMHDDHLPAPTPGQPRKAVRHHPYQRTRTRTSTGTELGSPQRRQPSAAVSIRDECSPQDASEAADPLPLPLPRSKPDEEDWTIRVCSSTLHHYSSAVSSTPTPTTTAAAAAAGGTAPYPDAENAVARIRSSGAASGFARPVRHRHPSSPLRGARDAGVRKSSNTRVPSAALTSPARKVSVV